MPMQRVLHHKNKNPKTKHACIQETIEKSKESFIDKVADHSPLPCLTHPQADLAPDWMLALSAS